MVGSCGRKGGPIMESRNCETCDALLIDDWNLAPIGANEDNTERIYAENVFLCDDCYDGWCTRWNTQPLEGE